MRPALLRLVAILAVWSFAPSCGAQPVKGGGAPQAGEAAGDSQGERLAAAPRGRPAAGPGAAAAGKPLPATPRIATLPFDRGVTAPDPIVAVIGLESLVSFTDSLRPLAKPLAGGGINVDELDLMALEGMADMYGWTDTSWYDTNAPVYAIVADPVNRDPFGFQLHPIRSSHQDVLAALPTQREQKPEHHDAIYRHGGAVWHVDFIGRYAAFSLDDDLFEKIHGFLRGQVVTWAPKGLAAQVSISSAMRIYGEEVRGVLELARVMMPEMKKAGDSFGGEASLDFAERLLVEMDSLTVSLPDIGAPRPRLEVAVRAVPGSGMEKFVKYAASAGCQLADRLPSEAWLSVVNGLDLRSVPLLRRLSVALPLIPYERLDLHQMALEELKQIFEQLAGVDQGQGAYAVVADGVWPLSFVGVQRHGDTTRARELHTQLLAVSLREIWPIIAQDMAGAGKPPKLKKPTLKHFAKALGKLFKRQKMRIKVKAIATKKDGVLVDGLGFEAARPKRGDEHSPEAMMHELLGGRFQFAIAYGSGLTAFAIGPDAVTKARSLASGVKAGGSDPQLVKTGAKAVAAISYDLSKAWKAFRKLPMGRYFSSFLPNLPGDATLRASLRSDGNMLLGSVDMPQSLLLWGLKAANF